MSSFLDRLQADDRTWTIEQIAAFLDEGGSHYRLGHRYSQSPYSDETESRMWETGWLMAFSDDGQPGHRLSLMEERLICQRDAENEELIAASRRNPEAFL